MPKLATGSLSGMVAATLMACLMEPSLAAESIVLSGVEIGGKAKYAYLGTVMPVGNGVLGDGWVHRLWLDYNRYQYAADNLVVQVKRASTEYALGYHGGSRPASYALYLGANYAYATPDPVPESFVDRGGKLRLRASAELSSELGGGWRGDFIASHLLGKADYWLRGRLTQNFHMLRVGPELIVQGDREYNMSKLGLLVSGIPLGKQGDLMFKIGKTWTDTGTSPYVGAEYVAPY
jgi:hypothetical protein